MLPSVTDKTKNSFKSELEDSLSNRRTILEAVLAPGNSNNWSSATDPHSSNDPLSASYLQNVLEYGFGPCWSSGFVTDLSSVSSTPSSSQKHIASNAIDKLFESLNITNLNEYQNPGSSSSNRSNTTAILQSMAFPSSIFEFLEDFPDLRSSLESSQLCRVLLPKSSSSAGAIATTTSAATAAQSSSANLTGKESKKERKRQNKEKTAKKEKDGIDEKGADDSAAASVTTAGPPVVLSPKQLRDANTLFLLRCISGGSLNSMLTGLLFLLKGLNDFGEYPTQAAPTASGGGGSDASGSTGPVNSRAAFAAKLRKEAKEKKEKAQTSSSANGDFVYDSDELIASFSKVFASFFKNKLYNDSASSSSSSLLKSDSENWVNPLEIFLKTLNNEDSSSSILAESTIGDGLDPFVIELGLNGAPIPLTLSVENELARALSESMSKALATGKEVHKANNLLFGDLQPLVLKTLFINCCNKVGETSTVTFPENNVIDWSKIESLAPASEDIFINSAYYYGTNDNEAGNVTAKIKSLWAEHLAYQNANKDEVLTAPLASPATLEAPIAKGVTLPEDCFYDPFSSLGLIKSLNTFTFDAENPIFQSKHAIGAILTVISLHCDKFLMQNPCRVMKKEHLFCTVDPSFNYVATPPPMTFDVDKTTFFLMDALIDVFTVKLLENGEDDVDSDENYSSFVLWSLISLVKALEVQLLLSSRKNKVIIGPKDLSSLDVNLVLFLRQKIIDLVGELSLQLRVDESLSPSEFLRIFDSSRVVAKKGTASSPFCSKFCKFSLESHAMKCLIAGFELFFDDKEEDAIPRVKCFNRKALFRKLVTNTTSQTAETLLLTSYPVDNIEFSKQFCELYFFNHLCLHIASFLELNKFIFEYPFDASDPSRYSSAMQRWDCLNSCDPVGSLDVDCHSTFILLAKRLSSPDILKNYTTYLLDSKLEEQLFFGELHLLKALQKASIQTLCYGAGHDDSFNFNRVIKQSVISVSDSTLKSSDCGKSITIESTSNVTKWTTAVSGKSFPPNSGVHEFQFDVRLCKNNRDILIGLYGADSTLNDIKDKSPMKDSGFRLGYHKNSVGLSLNGDYFVNGRMEPPVRNKEPSIQVNKSGLVFFGSSPTVFLRYDSAEGKLTASSDYKTWATLANNIFAENAGAAQFEVFPAVSFKNNGDKIEIQSECNRKLEEYSQREKNEVQSFMTYCKFLSASCSQLVTLAKAKIDAGSLNDAKLILSNPLLIVFLPSLTSSLRFSSFIKKYEARVSISLVPLLIKLFQNILSLPSQLFSTKGDLFEGDWKFKVGDKSWSSNLSVTPYFISEEISSSDAYKVTSANVSGSQLESKVHFFENNAKDSVYKGRLLLGGRKIIGKVEKRGSRESFVGTNVSLENLGLRTHLDPSFISVSMCQIASLCCSTLNDLATYYISSPSSSVVVGRSDTLECDDRIKINDWLQTSFFSSGLTPSKIAKTKDEAREVIKSCIGSLELDLVSWGSDFFSNKLLQSVWNFADDSLILSAAAGGGGGVSASLDAEADRINAFFDSWISSNSIIRQNIYLKQNDDNIKSDIEEQVQIRPILIEKRDLFRKLCHSLFKVLGYLDNLQLIVKKASISSKLLNPIINKCAELLLKQGGAIGKENVTILYKKIDLLTNLSSGDSTSSGIVSACLQNSFVEDYPQHLLNELVSRLEMNQKEFLEDCVKFLKFELRTVDDIEECSQNCSEKVLDGIICELKESYSLGCRKYFGLRILEASIDTLKDSTSPDKEERKRILLPLLVNKLHNSIMNYTNLTGLVHNGTNQNVKSLLLSSFRKIYDEANSVFIDPKTSDQKLMLILSNWLISIDPCQHQFLNQIGLFKNVNTVLQNVRDFYSEVRAQSSAVGVVVEGGGGGGGGMRDADTKSLVNMLIESKVNLARLSMNIVYCCATQVLFYDQTFGEILSKKFLPKQVSKLESGPRTLSESLFNLLYSELFNCLMKISNDDNARENTSGICCSKGHLLSLFGGSGGWNCDAKNEPGGCSSGDGSPKVTDGKHRWRCAQCDFDYCGNCFDMKTRAKTGAERPFFEDSIDIDNENYTMKILSLLYYLSSDKNLDNYGKSNNSTDFCQSMLSQPEWLSLLVNSIGFGSISIQKRILKIYRRLLCKADPESLKNKVLVPPFFANNRCQDYDYFEDQVPHSKEYIDSYFRSNAKATSDAENIIVFFLQGVSLIFDSDKCHKGMNKSFSGFYSSESLLILRLLYGKPKWRRVIHTVLEKVIRSSASGQGDSQVLYSSVLGFLGGYFDRFRIGGMVSVVPGVLRKMTEQSSSSSSSSSSSQGLSVSSNLFAVSQTCGFFMGYDSSGDLEVMFLDRGFYSHMEDGEASISHFTDVTSNRSVQLSRHVNRSTGAASTSRYSTDSIIPTYDIPFVPEVLSKTVFSEVLHQFFADSVSWAIKEKRKIISEPSKHEGFKKSPSSSSPSRSSEQLNISLKHFSTGEMTSYGVTASMLFSRIIQYHEDQKKLKGLKFFIDGVRVAPEDCPASLDMVGNDKEILVLTADEELPMAPPEPIIPEPPELEPSEDPDIFNAFLSASSFKAISNNLQSDDLVDLFIAEPAKLSDIFKLALSLTSYGGMNKLESLELNWVKYFDKCCELMQSLGGAVGESSGSVGGNRSPDSASSGLQANFASFLRDRESSRKERDSSSGGGRGGGGSFYSAGLGGSSRDPAQALLLAQQQAQQQAASAKPKGLVVDPAAKAQLMEMGFDEREVEVVLRAFKNDANAASNVLLGDPRELQKLMAQDKARQEREKEDEKQRASKASGASSTQAESSTGDAVSSPICVLGKDSVAFNKPLDLTNTGKFPCIGCKMYPVSSGKWYYEVEIITDGPCQFGWADSTYDGFISSQSSSGGSRGRSSSSSSQLPPESSDLNFWGFDGNQCYLWNGSNKAEWGSRWKAGDILGCAIDLDNRTLSFQLNGIAEEFNMGSCFDGFKFYEGVFPCANFQSPIGGGSNSAKVKFNFGKSVFKHSLPAGFGKYSDHVARFRDNSLLEITGSFSNKSLLAAYCDGYSKISNVSFDVNSVGLDPDFKSKYFDDLIKLPRVSESEMRIPDIALFGIADRRKVFTTFNSISRDVCVLYARTIVLQLFQKLSKVSNKLTGFQDNFSKFLFTEKVSLVKYESFFDSISKKTDKTSSAAASATTTTSSAAGGGGGGASSAPSSGASADNMFAVTAFECLLLLLRVCSAHTTRTKTYLDTLSNLSAALPVPQNLGSIFCTGGAPLLEYLRPSVIALLGRSSAVDHSEGGTVNLESLGQLLHFFVDLISIDLMNSTREEFEHGWIQDNRGLSPVILIQSPDSDSHSLIKTPSILFATYVTSIVINFIKSSHESISPALLKSCLHRLFTGYLFSFRSKSALVKSSACQVFSGIVSTLINAGGNLANEKSGLIAKLPIASMKFALCTRLDEERSHNPIMSRYMQNLLELYNVVSNEVAEASNSSIPFQRREDQVKMWSNPDPVEMEIDERFCTIDDSSWVVWTGTVVHDKIPEMSSFFPAAGSGGGGGGFLGGGGGGGDSLRRDQFSPVLGVGGKVWRNKTLTAPAMPPRSVSKVTLDSTQRTGEEIGTVIAVTTWPGDRPGSARLVRWDGGTKADETVRWGAGWEPSGTGSCPVTDKIFDVVQINVDKGELIPHPSTLLSDLGSKFFGFAFGYGVILRMKQHIPSKLESKTPIYGIIELSEFDASILVEVTSISHLDGVKSMTLTEKRLLKGSVYSSNWMIRYGSSIWKPGMTYELELKGDYSDTYSPDHVYQGKFNFKTGISSPEFLANCSGRVSLQKKHLFSFDRYYSIRSSSGSASRIQIIEDGKAAYCTASSGGSMSIAVGSNGFSSGVHYWELQMDETVNNFMELDGNTNAPQRTIFVGVAQKSFNLTPATYLPQSSQQLISNTSGVYNCRQLLSPGVDMNSSGRSQQTAAEVWGTDIQSHSIIGVLLDMNVGKMSIFLKCPGHSTFNDSFEHLFKPLSTFYLPLVTPHCKSTFFPVIGMCKEGTKISIKPNFISTYASGPLESSEIYKRAWQLTNYFSRPVAVQRPLVNHTSYSWLYRDAWKYWKQLRTGRFVDVTTRCSSVQLSLDISPRACLEASIRIGALKALFHGDKFYLHQLKNQMYELKFSDYNFHNEAKQTFVIIGAFNGQLYYRRLKSPPDCVEGEYNAWALTPGDIVSMIRIQNVQPSLVQVIGKDVSSELKAKPLDLTNTGKFSCIGCKLYPVSSGKWYYEVEIMSENARCQAGWADASFDPSSSFNTSSSSTSSSAAGGGPSSSSRSGPGSFVGFVNSGNAFKLGDIVGCAIDFESKMASFFLNGVEDLSSRTNLGGSTSFFPCVCFPNVLDISKFNFGSSGFKHPIPIGYQMYSVITDLLKIVSDSIKLPRLPAFQGCWIRFENLSDVLAKRYIEDVFVGKDPREREPIVPYEGYWKDKNIYYALEKRCASNCTKYRIVDGSKNVLWVSDISSHKQSIFQSSSSSSSSIISEIKEENLEGDWRAYKAKTLEFASSLVKRDDAFFSARPLDVYYQQAMDPPNRKSGYVHNFLAYAESDAQFCRDLSSVQGVSSLKDAMDFCENEMRHLPWKDLFLGDEVRSLQGQPNPLIPIKSSSSVTDSLSLNLHEDKDKEDNVSFASFVKLITSKTDDGSWTYDDDCELSDLLNKLGKLLVLSPINIPLHFIKDNIAHYEDKDHVIARIALLHVANKLLSKTIQSFSPLRLESQWYFDCHGYEKDIEIKPSTLMVGNEVEGCLKDGNTWYEGIIDKIHKDGACDITFKVSAGDAGEAKSNFNVQEIKVPIDRYRPKQKFYFDSQKHALSSFASTAFWSPSSVSRRLDNFKRVIYASVKLNYWNSVVDATTKNIPKSDDSDDANLYQNDSMFENQRFQAGPILPDVVISKHESSDLAKLLSTEGLSKFMEKSTLSQLQKSLERITLSPDKFRVSYNKGFIHTVEAEQKRFFVVQMSDSGTRMEADSGGPYRGVFLNIIEELQLLSEKGEGECLIPLLRQSKNKNRFILSPSVHLSPHAQDQMNFVGKLVGVANRHNIPLALPLGLEVSKRLTQEAISFNEFHMSSGGSPYIMQNILDEALGVDQCFEVTLSNEKSVDLIPNGSNIKVTKENYHQYVALAERANIRESSVMLKHFYSGLKQVLPVELFPIFTAEEFGQHFLYKSGFAFSRLKQIAVFKFLNYNDNDKAIVRQNKQLLFGNQGNMENLNPGLLLDHPVIRSTIALFWECLESLTADECKRFLVYIANVQLITFSQFTINFDFTLSQQHNWTTQTCSEQLNISPFYTKEALMERLRFVISVDLMKVASRN